MRRRRLTRREVTFRGLLLVVSGATAIALFEVAVYAIEAGYGPVLPGGPRAAVYHQGDPVVGKRHRSHVTQRYTWPEHPDGHLVIATNNLGLREDASTTTSPEEGVQRVLAIGDSQTDGLVNNSETWPNVLEAASQGRQEVLNAGVSGYYMWQYYLWWRTRGVELDPAVVLLGYFVGNDLMEAGGTRLTLQDDGSWTLDESARDLGSSTRGAWIGFFRRMCRSCSLASLMINRTIRQAPTYEELGHIRGEGPEERARHLAALRYCLGCVWQSLEQRWLLEGSSQRYARELEATAELLRRFREDARSEGTRFAVVLLPTKLQVEPGAASRGERAAELLGMEDVGAAFDDRVYADVTSLLRRLEIETIHVREALEEEHIRTGEPMYYDADWHLNVAGLRVVGETVGSALTESHHR